MINPPPSPPPAAPSQRRSICPTWVWIVLAFWALFQCALSFSPRPPGIVGRMAKAAEGRVDSDAFQDLMQVDLEAKNAFVTSLAAGDSAAPDAIQLKDVLSKAEDLEHGTHNSVSAVRRVIVLRALLGTPPFAVGKKSGAPLDAFGKDLSPGLSPKERLSTVREGALWSAAFDAKTPPHVREKLAVQIRALPNIRWWGAAATAAIYKSTSNPTETTRWNTIARSRAMTPVVSGGAILLARGMLALFGAGLLIILLVLAVIRLNNPETIRIWRIEPAIARDDRKITAGELAGVFIVYLLSRQVVTLIASGFTGLGHSHALQFHGLFSHFQPQIVRMSAQQRNTLEVVLESFVYVLTALPPIFLLMAIARGRGASLADEIGWNIRFKGVNFLYGVAGYALATPILLIVALIGKKIFEHSPSPANPVIPQIVGASGLLIPLLLLMLASIAAPFVEEILFRGVLMNALQMQLGPWPAIVVSGLIFGFAHPVGPGEQITIAVLGMVFAWMTQTRQSLLPSMTAHFVNNFTTTLLLLAVMSG
ncbi:MAG: type II CAAX endopeptidase family protein [Capsulimonas sp.]|uniref:CPBP family intramembrane glutamic endopeptidase n=1 Tax=Capsulimonas sp. TaxID=2494211 RepID=UPI003263817A